MTASIIVGLGFGDEGKGTVVDRLTRDQSVHTVVRFSGGCQTAHHVVLPDGTWHKFAQFGSGTFAGAQTYLSRFMQVNPLAMIGEAEGLATQIGEDPMRAMHVDKDALVTTPYHQALNRHRENARGKNRHGSCGQGIGETARYSIEMPTLAPTVDDISRPMMKDKLAVLRTSVVAEVGEDDPIMRRWSVKDLDEEYRQWRRRVHIVDREYLKNLSQPVLFEGSQGILLDEWRGFHPYTTWSTTTPTNALLLAEEAGIETEVLGVTRSYTTRHGDGPLPSESARLTQRIPEQHNGTGRFMGAWRAGHLDLVLLNYAAKCCERLDGIVVTHADRELIPDVLSVVAYEFESGQRLGLPHVLPTKGHNLVYQSALTALLLKAKPVFGSLGDGMQAAHFISGVIDVPLYMTSHGPTWKDKRVAPVLVG